FGPLVPECATDDARNLENVWRLGITAVEHPLARLPSSEGDQLGEVRDGRRVEARFAAVREHDHVAAVEYALDEVPLARVRRASAMNRSRTKDGRVKVAGFQQDQLDRALPARVPSLARLNGLVALG